MCGILVIHSFKGKADLNLFRKGMETLRKRGPNGEGFWVNPMQNSVMGHTRLSIMDLDGGSQPIANEDKSVWSVVNGEFYGHEKILSELRANGHRPGSRSDSEILVHLYEQMDTRCFEKLRGEFAFVIKDETKDYIFAARDRFGIKPLYYSIYQNSLYIASEAKAILAAGVPCEWDEKSVHDSFHLPIRQTSTLFKNIFQIPPGHYLIGDKNGVNLHRYWDAKFLNTLINKTTIDEAHSMQQMEQLLEDAVRIRTRADVPVACYLSGGVDSSAVLALASRFLEKKTAAFTISFDHKDYDERVQAAEMAHYAGVDFHSLKVTDQDFADVFADVVTTSEAVVFNTHAPARYLLSQHVKQAGYKVVLGGEGADEVFAGYQFIQKALQPRNKKNIPKTTLAPFLIKPSPKTNSLFSTSPFLALLVKVVGISDELSDYVRDKLITVNELLSPGFLRRFKYTDPYLSFFLQFRLGALVGREQFRQLLYLWMKSAFVNYVLAGERLDMVNGVELRLPFLDHHLFEAGARLPAKLLYKNDVNKYMLRTIARPYITEEVFRGEKKPFIGPPAVSNNSPLFQMFQDLLRSQNFKDVPFFNHQQVQIFLDKTYKMNEKQRAKHDPLFFMLASYAILQKNYKPGMH